MPRLRFAMTVSCVETSPVWRGNWCLTWQGVLGLQLNLLDDSNQGDRLKVYMKKQGTLLQKLASMVFSNKKENNNNSEVVSSCSAFSSHTENDDPQEAGLDFGTRKTVEALRVFSSSFGGCWWIRWSNWLLQSWMVLWWLVGFLLSCKVYRFCWTWVLGKTTYEIYAVAISLSNSEHVPNLGVLGIFEVLFVRTNDMFGLRISFSRWRSFLLTLRRQRLRSWRKSSCDVDGNREIQEF